MTDLFLYSYKFSCVNSFSVANSSRMSHAELSHYGRGAAIEIAYCKERVTLVSIYI